MNPSPPPTRSSSSSAAAPPDQELPLQIGRLETLKKAFRLKRESIILGLGRVMGVEGLIGLMLGRMIITLRCRSSKVL